jgi:ketosteroid isomerase-like protein
MTNDAMRQLVEDFHLALTAKLHGEAIELGTYLCPEVRWHLPRSSPLYDTLKGRDDVLALFAGGVEAYYDTPSIRFTYLATLVYGDRVALQCTMHATTANGRAYENDYCMLFRVQAGCIAEVWEYFDTAHLFSTLEAPE